MSIKNQAIAIYVALANRVAINERGQSTSEYGVAVLCAIALRMAVLAIVTGNVLDGPLEGLLKTVLKRATSMVG